MQTKIIVVFVALLIAGITGTAAATFGLGTKNENKTSATYQIAEVGTIVGAIMSFIGLGGLAYGAIRCNSMPPTNLASRVPYAPF